MHGTRPKIILAVLVVLVLAVVAGHHLSAPHTGGPAASSVASGASGAATARAPRAAAATTPIRSLVGAPSRPSSASTATGSAPPNSAPASRLPAVPVAAVTPQVVHRAAMAMRVGKGKLDSVLRTVTTIAGLDGGYVQSSSVTGGTARRSPVAGTVEFRVPDVAFAQAVSQVAALGTVEDQDLTGQDVTVQSAQNAASIAVLQDEVTLLETKLADAPDINTFLSIQAQLFPVETQLQRLQSAQAVLENSAALATIKVSLTAPGAPLVPVAGARPPAGADAATTAWRYLRHNTLAVLDGLAVAGGWALPVLVVLGLVGLVALRVIRRRRSVVPAA